MKHRNHEKGGMNFLQALVLCLSLAQVACSHDKVEATQSTNASSPVVKKTETTIPAVSEPARPEPITEKVIVKQAATGKLTMLKPGQSAIIDVSTTLRYVRLVSDSRCPIGTQCIWAGEATVELTLESGKEEQTFSLTDRTNIKNIMGFSVEMVSIDRGHWINIRAQKL